MGEPITVLGAIAAICDGIMKLVVLIGAIDYLMDKYYKK